jgi:hypothetical protein
MRGKTKGLKVHYILLSITIKRVIRSLAFP